MLWIQPGSFIHNPLNDQIKLIADCSQLSLGRIVHSGASLVQEGTCPLLRAQPSASQFSWDLRKTGESIEHAWQHSHLMLFLVFLKYWLDPLGWEYQACPLFSFISGVYWTLSQSPFCLCFFPQTPSWCIWSFLSPFIFAGRRDLYAAIFLPKEVLCIFEFSGEFTNPRSLTKMK